MSTGIPVQIIAPGIVSQEVLSVDVVLEETHDFDSRVTKFPVESGATISDHIWNDPVVVTMVGLVTNSPVRKAYDFAGIELQQQLNTGASPELPPDGRNITGEDYVQDFFDKLQAIRDARQTVTLITGLQRYKDMALVHLDVPRNRKTGNVIQFNARFEVISFAGAQTVQYLNLRSGKSADQAGVLDAAKQSTTPIDDNSTFARTVRNAAYKFLNVPLTPIQRAGVSP